MHDRIDWVLVAGRSETEASEILGEDGGPDVNIDAGDPFPSDHRGVVSTFSVEPQDTPTLVSVDERRLIVGDTVRAVFYPPGDDALVTIVPAGAVPHGIDDTGRPAGPSEGEVMLSTAGLDPGAYDAVLVHVDGKVLSRSPFWLYEPGAAVEVSATRASYRAGQPITFTWRNTPGNRWDWVGL